MKKIIPLIALSFICVLGNAQEKTLNEIALFEIKNSGAFIDKNKDVDGYYFYYEVDKLSKDEREYAIKMLDNNLNEIGTKSYVDQKNTYLADSKFNNHALMFAMVNKKEEQYKLVTFDKKGNQAEDIIIPISKKEIKSITNMERTGAFNLLFPVDDKGFLFNSMKENKKMGYSLKYIPTDGGNSWGFNSAEDVNELMSINPIEANEEVVVALQSAKKSATAQSVDLKVIVLDIHTGKLLFEKEYDRENNPRLVTNAFLTQNKKVVLLGEYFDKGENIIKDDSKGLFAQILELNGEDISDFKVSWEEKIDEMMPPDSDGKKRTNTYVYFHDIVRTKKGNYYCIGEKYRKTVSLSGVLGMTVNPYGATTMTQLTITDAVIFEFGSDFSLKDIKVFEKGKSRAPSLTDFGSPQLNAHLLKASGAFDYEFVQIDTDRDRFYANFIDYERLKGEENKLAFKTIIYNDGKFFEDKIYLSKSRGKIQFRVLPAKLGNVMLMEFNKKEKTLQIHLEKLNM
ncbi:DUF6770 family protein [Aestuariibaculum lutulentum]|uniref:Uncharacterized protein n=1 Tax=Aestuariibaculum lutulentum TaxID=2920935 RepID=A0ABS9RJP8_9FLAO|nr:DUF6770 family protein [Aestuariibaculum lutulentum]MCH4553172.1 hypothetical protein [Aestuariibaculum lutulentum]